MGQIARMNNNGQYKKNYSHIKISKNCSIRDPEFKKKIILILNSV